MILLSTRPQIPDLILGFQNFKLQVREMALAGSILAYIIKSFTPFYILLTGFWGFGVFVYIIVIVRIIL